MEKSKKRALVVALLLPIFILVSVSVSHAFVNNQIQASVTVNPKPSIYCNPTTLTKGSSVQWIYCFTELIGADVHDIDPANVFLTIPGKSGSVQADTSFKQFGDFNSNGQTEIMLRFSRASADSLWFNSLTQNTPLTFSQTGTVKGFPFSGTSPIFVIINKTVSFAQYFQINAPDIGGATVNWIFGPSWFNYTKYTPSYLHFSGYFSNSKNLFGISTFYSEGTVKMEKTLNYILFTRTFTVDQPVTITVNFKSYSDCTADPVTKNVHCQGPGTLLINKVGTGQTTAIDLSNLMFDITNYKATIQGGNVFNEIFKVSGITMTNIYIN
jgi:hypothetical protein